MAKLLSKSELENKAKVYFKKLGVSKLYATSDGQLFILESRAKLHAGSGGQVHEMTTDERPEVAKDDSANEASVYAKMSVKELKEAIADLDLETLHKVLADEVQKQNRKSAVELIENKIAELTK